MNPQYAMLALQIFLDVGLNVLLVGPIENAPSPVRDRVTVITHMNMWIILDQVFTRDSIGVPNYLLHDPHKLLDAATIDKLICIPTRSGRR